jgi:RNA polymerase sigma-70 factor (ECF subfamily)
LRGKEFALTGTRDPAVGGMERIVRIVRSDELVDGCRQGSLPTFERLYEEHGARMKSIARNLLGSAPEAEDAVQDAFLRVYRSLGRFRGGSAFSTWVYRILVNVCYDRLRTRRRSVERPMPARIALAPAGETDHPLRLSIEAALSRLEERERAAFLLCEVEGFSHKEAGEILEVSEGSSRALLFKARRQLQQELRASGAFEPERAS